MTIHSQKYNTAYRSIPITDNSRKLEISAGDSSSPVDLQSVSTWLPRKKCIPERASSSRYGVHEAGQARQSALSSIREVSYGARNCQCAYLLCHSAALHVVFLAAPLESCLPQVRQINGVASRNVRGQVQFVRSPRKVSTALCPLDP